VPPRFVAVDPQLPPVSVVVPARDAERTLASCLDSLLALRYPRERLELIVVDNGSCDRTPALVAERAPALRLVREPIRNRARARNAGIRASDGGVVAFTDADCVVHEAWLKRLVGELDDRDVGVAGGPILPFAPCGTVERYGARIRDQRRNIEVFHPPYVDTANCAVRRDTLERLGGFDPRFTRSQDVDLSYRAVALGYRLAFAPGAVVCHRNRSTLPALAWEGALHGYSSVQLRKVHDSFLRSFRPRRRFDRAAYREIARGLRAALADGDSRELMCEPAFNLGKRAGKLAGSVRHRTVDL
jgi:cellulose synthase/poly-beta-1,6-N-acetylglucosamine synthase-like glycosyltransferase